MDFLRDPIWQFIGAAIGVIAVFVSVYIYTAQRSKKSLSYEILTSTELLSLKKEIQGKVQILFENKPIENVYHVVIKIINDGSYPLSSTLFERPLSFSFHEKTIILSAEVVESYPSTLHPELVIEKNHVILKPLLLNSGDNIQISLLLAQHNGSINIDARIEGINEVKRGIKAPLNPAARWIIAFIVSSVLGMMFLYFLVEASRPYIIVITGAILLSVISEYLKINSK